MWRNEPCGGSTAGSHFLSHLAPNKMERSRQVWVVVRYFAGWITTSDGREERTTILSVGCHSLSSLFSHSFLLLPFTFPPLLCDHRSLPLTLQQVWEGRLKMRINEVWGKRFLHNVSVCVHISVCLCMHLLAFCVFISLPLLQCLVVEPKDRPGTLHPLAAERPRGWIEPCRLGYYQYSPSRQPGRQKTEPLIHSAY